MRKMGFTHPNAQPSSVDRRSYDTFFDKNLTDGEVAAMDELFPAMKSKADRMTCQPLATVA